MRTIDWHDGLSKRLRKKSYAKSYFKALMKEGETWEKAVAHMVRAYGVNEIGRETKILSTNVSRILRNPRVVKRETLDKILKPLGLKTKLTIE